MPSTRPQRSQCGVKSRNNNSAPCGNGQHKTRGKEKKKMLMKDCSTRSRTRSGREYGTLLENKGDKKVNRKSNSKSPPRSTRQCKEYDRKAQLKEIKQRIASINIQNRPIPDTDDINILATELKVRLAATSDIIEEKVAKRGAEIHVIVSNRGQRIVPLWSINRHQDPTLICSIKVPVTKPKNKPRRKCM